MSGKEECVSARKNFRPREWIMLIIILGLIEAGVLIASNAFKSSQDILNYISFASTIASLLLAVLAIVYGFYQSESQKKAGDGVEVHLSHLRTTADQIRAVSTTLSDNSSGVNELSTSLKKLNDALHATQNKLSAVEGSVNGFAKQQESFGASLKEMRSDPVSVAAANREPPSKPVNDEIANIFLGEHAALHIKIVAVAFLFAFEEKDGVKIKVEEIGPQIVEVCTEEKLMEWSSDTWVGAVLVAFSVLMELEIINYVFANGENVKFFTFNRKKISLLNEVAETLWKNPIRVELLGKLKKSMQELPSETATS